jgi:hypothetical protein
MDVRLLLHESDRYFMALCTTVPLSHSLTPRHYSPCRTLAFLKNAAHSLPPPPRPHHGSLQPPPSSPHVHKVILYIVEPSFPGSFSPSVVTCISHEEGFIGQETVSVFHVIFCYVSDISSVTSSISCKTRRLKVASECEICSTECAYFMLMFAILYFEWNFF